MNSRARPPLAELRQRYASHFPDCKIHPHGEVLALLDWIEAADKTLQRIRNGHGVPARAGASLDEDCLADIDALLSPSGSPEPPKP